MLTIASVTRILARNTCGQNGQWFHTHVFAHLEEFVETYLSTLVISPYIAQGLAVFERTDCLLPTIHISYAIAVSDTTAWETHEARMQGFQRLCQIATKPVSFVGVLRNEGDHIDAHRLVILYGLNG